MNITRLSPITYRLPILIQQSCLTTPTSTTTASCQNQSDMITTIYRWPLIRHFRFIARLKTYQTAAMTLSLPPLTYLYKMGSVTNDSVFRAGLAAGGAVAVLSILSYGFSKIVGELKYNCRTEVLLVSYLSFIGNKKTIEVNVDQVVPFDDIYQHGSQNRIMLKLRLECGGKNSTFYYSYKYGEIVNSEMFKRILSITF